MTILIIKCEDEKMELKPLERMEDELYNFEQENQ